MPRGVLGEMAPSAGRPRLSRVHVRTKGSDMLRMFFVKSDQPVRRAPPPDDQGDEGEGAHVLEEQDVRRGRGAQVQGQRQGGGGQQDVHEDGHEDGHHDDHGDVDGREARAELVHDDRDGSRIRGWPRHEKDQRRSRTEALGHQRGGDGRACGGANVKRDADQDHDRVGRPLGVFVVHQGVGNRQIEQSSHGDAEEQREQDVVGDLHETVVKDVPDDGLEAGQVVSPGEFDVRSVLRLFLGRHFLAIELRLDPEGDPPVGDLRQERPEAVAHGNLQL